MQLSQRLLAVVMEISGRVLADIGTDHGYIAIEAVRSSRVERAIACDVNQGPLRRAEANVAEARFSDQIELRLGDGLSPVKAGEADCVSIAGMGGMLTIDILSKGEAVVRSIDRLVLQPQLDIASVRRFVHDLGFKIVSEHMLFEGKFYTVIACERGQDAEYSRVDYAFGKLLIDSRDTTLKLYLEKKISDFENILRIHEVAGIRSELAICEEVLRCY